MASGKNLTINGKKVSINFTKGFTDSVIHPKLQKKLIPRNELSDLGAFLRRRGMTISFTTGVYDMIHIGHVRYLELAKTLGDTLVVGLNTDKSVKRLKGENRPILEEDKRAEMLSFLEVVDFITYFDEDDGGELIKLLKPDSYLCVEGSWTGDLITKKEVVAISKFGGKVFYTPRQGPTISTSNIIERISKQAGEVLVKEFSKRVKQGFGF